MTKQSVLDFKKWLADTAKLEENQVVVTPSAPAGEAAETQDATDQVQKPFGGDLVASGTAAFMRLHRVQKQMRSTPAECDQRANATNVAHSKTAVNDRLHAAYEEVVNELSKGTLKSYVKKAKTSEYRLGQKGDKEEDKSMSTDGNKYPEKQARHQAAATKLQHKQANRWKGIERAEKKLKEGLDIHIKRPGALTAKAKAAGESNSQYEAAHKNDKGLSGKQARFAINAKKWKH